MMAQGANAPRSVSIILDAIKAFIVAKNRGSIPVSAVPMFNFHHTITAFANRAFGCMSDRQ